MNFSKDLKHKIELFGNVETQNSIGEIERNFDKIKDVWAQVIPKHSSNTQNYGDSLAEQAELRVTILTRKKSIVNPTIDMYFMYKGKKYEIIDFIEDMKTNSFWEFNCKLNYQ